MTIRPFSPKAAALVLWSCLGCGLIQLFPARTDAAWHVALVVLGGQVAIAAAASILRRAG